MASMAHLLYLGSYPEARLSTYDPVKPLRFGNIEESIRRTSAPWEPSRTDPGR